MTEDSDPLAGLSLRDVAMRGEVNSKVSLLPIKAMHGAERICSSVLCGADMLLTLQLKVVTTAGSTA